MPESIVDVLQKATGDGIFIVQNGSITAVNNATIKLLGFSEKQLINKPLLSLISDEKKGEVSQVLASNTSETIQTVGITAKGEHYQLSLRIQPTLLEGTPMQVVAISKAAGNTFRDTLEEASDRDQTIENLRQQTALVQLLHKVAVSANETNEINVAFRTCLDDICSYTKWPIGHAYILSPIDPNLLVPSDIWHLRDPQDFFSFQQITMKTTFKPGVGLPGRVLETGRPAWVNDVMDDENFPRAKYALDIGVHSAFAFPVVVEESVVAVLEFFSDKVIEPNESLLQVMQHIGTQQGQVVARKRAEKELSKAKLDADIANMAKSELLANMSHELRTPLNAIIGFSDVLGDELIGELANAKQREYINDIKNSGEHLLKLINDVLDVSAIEAGKVDLYEETLVVTNVFNAAVRLITPQFENGQLTLTIQASDDLPLIFADERRLKQIFLNLLSNAIKFSHAGGQITLSALLGDGGTLIFSVSDTGIGMNDAEIEKALSQFGQVDGTISRKVEGTGLGLPLSKGLIELHGGSFEIESEKGTGTMVTVTLPKERVLDDQKPAKNSN
jgi:two-component system, sensor histidine kinase and response regulator